MPRYGAARAGRPAICTLAAAVRRAIPHLPVPAQAARDRPPETRPASATASDAVATRAAFLNRRGLFSVDVRFVIMLEPARERQRWTSVLNHVLRVLARPGVGFSERQMVGDDRRGGHRARRALALASPRVLWADVRRAPAARDAGERSLRVHQASAELRPEQERARGSPSPLGSSISTPPTPRSSAIGDICASTARWCACSR